MMLPPVTFKPDAVRIVIMCLAIAFAGVAMTLPLLKLLGVLLLSWPLTLGPLGVCVIVAAFIVVANTKDE